MISMNALKFLTKSPTVVFSDVDVSVFTLYEGRASFCAVITAELGERRDRDSFRLSARSGQALEREIH